MRPATFRAILWVLFFLPFLSSCLDERPLVPCSERATLQVEFPADFGDLEPQSVQLIAYDINNTPYHTKINGTKGSLTLPPGRYNFLAYTSDFYPLDAILYSSLDTLTKALAYTRVSPLIQASMSPVYMTEPDPLFSGSFFDLQINRTSRRLTLELDRRSYRYWFSIEVDGLEYINSAFLELSGLYTSVYLADGSHSPLENGIQHIETQKQTDPPSLYGEFYSFGPNSDNSILNRMVLTLVTGTTHSIELDDLTPLIKNLPHGGLIPITQKIVISADSSGTGFDPEVKDWDDTQIETPI